MSIDRQKDRAAVFASSTFLLSITFSGELELVGSAARLYWLYYGSYELEGRERHMNFHNLAIQFAVLYAPFLHCTMEQVTPNLSRGPDPKIKDIYALHDQGIKTIISLRTNPETKKQKLCQQLGMKWIQIKTGVFMTPTAAQFDQFRAIVNDPQFQPCYTSCEIDMDRTGVYIAAYRMVDQQWSASQMQEEFNQHHQKKWWPIFRKYERVVTAYADNQLPQEVQNGQADVVQLPTTTDSQPTALVKAESSSQHLNKQRLSDPPLPVSK